MLDCLGARTIEVSRGEAVFLEGDPAEDIGILLSGAVQIVRNDYSGNRSILADAGPSELFGEAFACAQVRAIPVSVVAVCDSEILLADCRRILHVCGNTCRFHTQLIRRLLRIVAEKNLMLNQKIEIISKRTTREKLMAYLSLQAKKNGSPEFTIPYDRQGLADYLGVERSAMSAEISSKEVPIEDLQTRRKMQYIRRKDASNKRTGKFISGTAGGEASAGRIKYYSESGQQDGNRQTCDCRL